MSEKRSKGEISAVGRKLPRFLQEDEPEALLRAADTQRDRVLLHVAFYFGLRVSELCKLDVRDLDFKRRTLFVRDGKGKKDRMVPMPRKMVGPLRGWVAGRRDGPVFPSRRGGRLTTRAVQLLFKRVAARAGLHGALETRRVTPHKMRHAYATRLLQTGSDIMEVKELLGHASIQTTMQYLHTDPKRLAAAVDRL